MLNLREAAWGIRTYAVVVLVLFLARAASPAVASVSVISLALASSSPPSPLFLRALCVVGRVYTVLVFVAALRRDDAVLRVLASDTRSSPAYRPEGCALTYANVLATIDFYALAHVFGHVVKGAMLRSRMAVWISVVVFEAVEVVLASTAPRLFGYLRECWWDRFALDPLCNFLGTELGIALVGGGSRPFFRGFLPVAVGLVVAATDVLHFCLLTVLKLDVKTPLLAARMLLYASLGFPAVSALRKSPGKEMKISAGSPYLQLILCGLGAEILLCAVHATRGA